MKTKSFLSVFVISLFLLTTFTSCEKDPATQLSGGVWIFENLTSDTEDENIRSLVALAKALMTDATLEFQDGGTYIITSPLMDEPTTGTWSLIGDDQLVLDPDDQLASTANIETLTRKQLVYIETYSDMQDGTYSVTTSWTRE
ncbi:MAG TPA: hypothetical protein ENO05_09355 [Bacteroides sp.]|nr:hypothetical protein [Bacteroides sp.]